MSADSGSRPSLRLIAGDLINTIANDIDSVADLAIPGRAKRGASTTSPRPSGPSRERASQVPRVAIIGGGIAGLAAAWSLVKDRGFAGELTVFDSDETVGGKLKLIEMEGMSLDAGAEALLAVRPEAVRLARSVGLTSSIVHPASSQASILSRGKLHPVPAGLITGIPTDLRALAASDILSSKGLMRIPLDYMLPKIAIDGDVSVGEYVGARMGQEVVDRLVEPMLGGVYAGRSSELSLEMAVPALFRLARNERSLLAAAKEARATGAAGSGARRGPVFAGISGGVGRLPIAIADKLRRRGVTVSTGTTVTGLRRSQDGWRLLVTETGGSRRATFDSVILAVPAPAAAKLLRNANPGASAGLDTIGYASVAVVTMLFDPDKVPGSVAGSGFLVPPIEGFAVKAATYSSRKWAWVARAGAPGSGRAKTKSKAAKPARQGFMVARASLGRFGEPKVLQRENGELVTLAASELNQIAGFPKTPVAAQVTRWGGALPQYTVGHRTRIAGIREALVDSPGLALCGAAYDGVGIAACIGSAQFAAGQVSAYLAERAQPMT